MGYYTVERIEKSNVEVDNIWSLKLFFFLLHQLDLICASHISTN